MASNPLRELNAAGQSVWYDNIQRAMLQRAATGRSELERLIAEDDLRGVTSNPTIFEKAITGSSDYDRALGQALDRGERNPRALFYSLATEDIRAAADQLRPVYEATGGVDGMVSLEVSPDLADDTEATVHEACELWARLDRPNAMIKVPATAAGVPAVQRLIAEGINVNVTLLFSVERYLEIVEAYIRGLEERQQRGLDLRGIASVASFFVSRVDSALDPVLANRAPELAGGVAIANARVAYRHWQARFTDGRFEALVRAGARPQRLLWASTSTKNPAYRDVLYVESLIGRDTVNTLPPATYEAFRDHGRVEATLAVDPVAAQALLARLGQLDIDLAEVTDRLEREGVAAFAKSFHTLLEAIESKASALSRVA